jgi:hypothetical protein
MRKALLFTMFLMLGATTLFAGKKHARYYAEPHRASYGPQVAITVHTPYGSGSFARGTPAPYYYDGWRDRDNRHYTPKQWKRHMKQLRKAEKRHRQHLRDHHRRHHREYCERCATFYRRWR